MLSIRYLVLGVVCAALAAAGCAGQPNASVCPNGIVCPDGTQCAAAQIVCITNNCGNGLIDQGEQCDDGNILDADGCSHSCTIEACGNGNQDPGEICDDGNTRDGDGCSHDCKSVEVCGNKTVDTAVGEVCDDGNTVSGDGCSADCKSTEVCGNGIKDIHELCDDNRAPGGCNDDCQGGTGCGDGSIDKDMSGLPIEQCDDGNLFDDDDCLSSKTGSATSCKLARCGDGVKQTKGARLEECDGGTTGTAVQTATCNIDCTLARCGDGKVNKLNTASPATAIGEQCDDGDNVDGNGCDTNCTISGCGNAIKSGTEECDDGNPNNGDGCDTNCKITKCGNGIKTGTEACDDGNTNSNDGCSAICVVEFCGDGTTNNVTEQCDTGTTSATCNADCTVAACGDGKINQLFTPAGAAGPEQCDDNNTNNNDGCSSKCQFEFCGDGTKNNITEQCDTTVNSQTCNADCTLPKCGDGKLNPSFKPVGAPGGEQCDDGGNAPNDGCSATCQFERCGNNIIDPGEQCDGSPVGGFACLNCHLVKCGDGIVDTGEQCDDGNATATDDCVSDNANPATCKIATCGDGVRNTNREECDHGATNGMAGDTCSATCHTVTCGNGIIEQGETCDDGPPASNNAAGKSCNATCHRNTCGDGDKLVGIEQCDSSGVDTTTCDADCTFAVCGDNRVNTVAGEVCDHGATNGTLGDTCDAFCKVVGCGNNFVDFGEQCDPGTPGTNTLTCDKDCTLPLCGDGLTNTAANETCDDGANNGEPCAYGTSCMRCNSTCTTLVTSTGPSCGDGTKNGPEVCDQGTLFNGTACAYGSLFCLSGAVSTICKANCTGFIPNPNGPFCGDNLVQSLFNEQCDPGGGLIPVDTATCDKDCSAVVCGDGHVNTVSEACDDNNGSACGSCGDDCLTSSLAATGAITAVAASLLVDGETFTLNDGFHTPATVFEFRKTGLPTGTHVAVNILAADNAATVRDKVVAAINGVGATLDITATAGVVATLTLANTHLSSTGNTGLIAETVVDATFLTTAMVGGTGTECPTGIGCKTGADCISGTCAATGRCL